MPWLLRKLRRCPAPLGEMVRSSITPQGAGYDVPSDRSRGELGRSITAMIHGRRKTAVRHARRAGYRVCRGRGSERAVAVWRPKGTGAGRSLVAWRPGYARPLLVEAPHPQYDRGTLEQALAIFERTRARALIVAGVHRCAGDVLSACDGMTGVCGGVEPYRESDMAHNTETTFHAAHEALAELHPGAWVASLHGMNERGVSLSDGTIFAVRAGSPVALLANAIADELPHERVTTCNIRAGGLDLEHLCGLTNVQGRHLNWVDDACTEEPSRSSGRFVHLELSSRVRMLPYRVAGAFLATLPDPQPLHPFIAGRKAKRRKRLGLKPLPRHARSHTKAVADAPIRASVQTPSASVPPQPAAATVAEAAAVGNPPASPHAAAPAQASGTVPTQATGLRDTTSPTQPPAAGSASPAAGAPAGDARPRPVQPGAPPPASPPPRVRPIHR